MDDDALRRALRSVGYRCFIVYKDIFLDTSIPMDAAAHHLHITEKRWSIGGCLMRLGQTGTLFHLKNRDAISPARMSYTDPVF
ncbi:hypothetical protein [Prosthecodimorpha staleyi]|uniref:Uncharacterized protein n=1 Tax=Prosthecodimorpha staleyi TaxID=2840188 RepID=A0A947GBN6_9HYPH|nr:hypothetical protein [Prosthecodimorpha staleyi]MBT9288261.1 hypothetical protein [Prosthecodimorpha staleyi]